ncbi:MAG: tetratricopeptide repeat protein [Myxococcota bacterium]|nr:tetratricopeptide repeat protein [Myxococcota bacterium]
MIRTLSLLVICLTGWLGTASGQNVETAQKAYWAGNFKESANQYRALATSHPHHADLWYNLGTAEAQAGRLGYAVYALEQALILNPDDEAASKNLERIRGRIIDNALKRNASDTLVLPGSDDLGTGLLSALNPSVLRWIFGLTWPLLFLSIVLASRVSRPSGRTAFSFSAVVIGLIAFSAGGLLLARGHVVDGGSFGVLTQEKTVARRGPGVQYAKQAVLAAGVKVALAGSDRNWQQITLPNGMGAWIRQADVEQLSKR